LHRHTDALAKSGKYKTGKVCLYRDKTDGFDLKVLNKMVEAAAKKYPCSFKNFYLQRLLTETQPVR